MSFRRSVVLTCPIDATRIIENSEGRIESEGQTGFSICKSCSWEQPSSNQGTGATPIIEDMITDLGAQATVGYGMVQAKIVAKRTGIGSRT